MSPTSPTFVALNDQLIKAHRRIRELEAELLAQDAALCATISELTHVVHARSDVELTSNTVQISRRTHRQPPAALRLPPRHA